MPDTTIITGGSGQSDAYTQAAGMQYAASQKAAEAQLQAARESNALIKGMWQTGRADLAPWRSTGQTALDVYNRMLGLPSVYSTQLPMVPGQEYPDLNALAPTKTTPTGQTGGVGGIGDLGTVAALQQYLAGVAAGTIPNSVTFPQWLSTQAAAAPPPGGTSATPGLTQDQILAQYNQATSAPSGLDPTAWIKQTPGYQFQYGEGLNALDRSAASRGMLLSGQQTRAAQEYGQNFALGQYDNYMNKLANLAGIGQTTAGQGAQAGQNMATASAANTMGAAQNASMANMAGANAIGSGYVNAANAAQQGQNSLWGNLGQIGGLGLGALSAWGGGAGAGAGLGGAMSAIGSFFSDKRLKKNIVEMDIDGLPMVEKMQPVYFDYLPGVGGLDQVGFVADDIEKIIPSAVIERNGYKMVNPLPIMAVLVKAIKEQQQQIDKLRGNQNV